MADVVYRANLKAASFPMLSELHGRSVIVKQYDQNFINGLAPKESLDSSIGAPQIYYAHNVVPTDQGYQSVGYSQFTNNAELPGDSDFSSVHLIQDGSGNAAQIAVTDSGDLYILTALSGKWTAVTGAPAAGTIAGKRITTAFVAGVTYIYFANVGCYSYNFGTATLGSVTLTGLTAANIKGIVGGFGYLLAYSKDEFVWSSTIDPTDFTPSLETGAGGGSVEDARGEIITAELVYGAIVIFTTRNAVAAVSSGNIRYPFNFAAITGAGGLSSPDYVSYDVGAGALYAYTTSGLQTVSARQASTVFPEITDFLSGSYFETFDENTHLFSTISTSGAIQKRIAVIADRYLIISYGNEVSLTHAIYYDTAYKQFGRLQIDHVDCFEFQLYDQSQIETPRSSIGFLQANGTIKIVDFGIEQAAHTGVMLIGKFQFVRSRMMQLNTVELENINAGATFSCYDLPALDGKNFETALEGSLLESAGKYRKYGFGDTDSHVAINHSLLCQGQFNIVSAVLTFNVHGI